MGWKHTGASRDIIKEAEVWAKNETEETEEESDE